MSQMVCSVITGPRKVETTRVPIPEVGPRTVLIRVKVCYLCGSDLHGWAQRPGARASPTGRPGHEFAGIVEAVGTEVRGINAGDQVSAVAIQGCRVCPTCHAGSPQGCPDRRVVGFDIPGGFAEYVAVDAEWVVRQGTPTDLILAGLREPFSVAVQCVDHRCGNPRPGSYAVVQAPGGIGIFSALVLRRRGVNVLITGLEGKDEEFRLPAAARLGFKTAAVTKDGLTTKQLEDKLGVSQVPLVVDATGFSPAVTQAFAHVRYGGYVTAVGIYGRDVAVTMPGFVRSGQTFAASYGSAMDDYLSAAALIDQGIVPSIDLVGTRYDLADLNKAFEDAEEGWCLRPYVVFDW